MTLEVHALDWDDTCVRTGGWTPEHYRNVTPIDEVIAEVRALIGAGHPVHIVSGRHGEEAYQLAVKQVREFLGEAFPLENIHTIREHEEFQGNDYLASWKAEVLTRIKAKTFRGDTVTDLKAAEIAKVAFTWVGKLNG